MSNIIYILSMITAAIWLFLYLLLNNVSPALHLLIVVAFAGTLTSLFMDDNKSMETIKDNKNLQV